MASLTDGTFVDSLDINPITFDTGDLKMSARRTPPSGWLLCDGSAVSRTTYAALFAVLCPSLGAVTVTIASPGVFTLTAHGLIIGDQVYLTTTGALPAGLAANTVYFVVSTPTADTFTLSATRGGSAINTSGTQSGTHTLNWCPWGLGDGSTTFNVPDFSGRMFVTAAGALGHVDVGAVGGNNGTALAYRRPKHRHTPHTHSFDGGTSSTAGSVPAMNWHTPSASPGLIETADGGSGVSTDPLDAPAYAVANLFIKT